MAEKKDKQPERKSQQINKDSDQMYSSISKEKGEQILCKLEKLDKLDDIAEMLHTVVARLDTVEKKHKQLEDQQKEVRGATNQLEVSIEYLSSETLKLKDDFDTTKNNTICRMENAWMS